MNESESLVEPSGVEVRLSSPSPASAHRRVLSCRTLRSSSEISRRRSGSLPQSPSSLSGHTELKSVPMIQNDIPKLELQKEDEPRDKETQKRLYEIWPGRNRFCCFGRCITGTSRDLRFTLLSWGLIIAFTVVYGVLAIPTLISSVNIMYPCFSAVLFVLTVVFFLRALHCQDPGPVRVAAAAANAREAGRDPAVLQVLSHLQDLPSS